MSHRLPNLYLRQSHGDDDDDDDDDRSSSSHSHVDGPGGQNFTSSSTRAHSTLTNSNSLQNGPTATATGNGIQAGNKQNNAGKVAGGVISALLVIGILVFLYWRRRVKELRRKQMSELDLNIESPLVEHKEQSYNPPVPINGKIETTEAPQTREDDERRRSRRLAVANPDFNISSQSSKTLGVGHPRDSELAGDGTTMQSMNSEIASWLPEKSAASNGPSSWKWTSNHSRQRSSSTSESDRQDSDNASICSSLVNPYSVFEDHLSRSTSAAPHVRDEKPKIIRLSVDGLEVLRPNHATDHPGDNHETVEELRQRVEALKRENALLSEASFAPPAYQK